MGNINTIVNNDMCCGCGICAGVCSENCISMDINLNGFYRPTMNRENCSNCGKCLNICPSGEAIVHEEEGSMFGEVISVYAGWAKDENIRYNSASGGIATAISLELLDKGFAVGGTSFDETNTLRTISIVTKEASDIYRFQSSKYMPSEYSDVVKYVMNHSTDKLLIIGLPCQIAGIRKIVGYNRENIILIDIFCGRVMSYRLIELVIEEKLNGKIKNINFRDKKSGWNNFSLTLSESKNEISERFRESIFGRFLNNKIFTQTACYKCKFGSAGLADITLGDYWNEKRYENEKKGVSIIVIRTENGRQVIKSCESISVEEVNKGAIYISQPHFKDFQDNQKIEKLIKINNKIYFDLKKLTLKQMDHKYNDLSLRNKIFSFWGRVRKKLV